MKKKVAVVILNWNGADMLRKYLPTVVEYSLKKADIYVADNASTDDSVELLKTTFPKVNLILFDQNWGFAEGYNKALAQIKAEYYVLLNSDVEVTRHWLSPLIEFMDANPLAAACQPKLLSMYERDTFEYAGACGGYIDRLGYPFCRGRVFDVVEKDHGQYDRCHSIHWASGAALFVRSEAFEDVGGFDSRFFAHQEEIDLCWRMRIRGSYLVCLPESVVYHVGGGTLPKSNPMKTYLNFRNNLTMLYKCLPQRDLRWVMIIRWFLDYLAAYQTLLLHGNVGDFKAIYRARRDFKRWKKDFTEDRLWLQEHHILPAKRFPATLLLQYYLFGRRTFSKLVGIIRDDKDLL